MSLLSYIPLYVVLNIIHVMLSPFCIDLCALFKKCFHIYNRTLSHTKIKLKNTMVIVYYKKLHYWHHIMDMMHPQYFITLLLFTLQTHVIIVIDLPAHSFTLTQ